MAQAPANKLHLNNHIRLRFRQGDQRTKHSLHSMDSTSAISNYGAVWCCTMVSSLLGCHSVLLHTMQAAFLYRVQSCILTIAENTLQYVTER